MFQTHPHRPDPSPRLRRIAALGPLALLFLAGCGGGGGSAPSSAPPAGPGAVSKFVYVANAGGGVSGFALDDATGNLGELPQSPYDEDRPSLHVAADPLGRFVFSVRSDGTASQDALAVYRVDPRTGDLASVAANPTVATAPGPWCAAVDPTGTFVYVRCATRIAAYRLDRASGALTSLDTVAASAGPGDLAIAPSGRFLFAAGRGSDRIEAYAIRPGAGTLTLVGSAQLPAGTGPVGVALNAAGDTLFTKGEGAPGGDAIACSVYSFRVDAKSGGLTALAPLATGMRQSDTYHGVGFHPALQTFYAPSYNASHDLAAFQVDPAAGQLAQIAGSPYVWMGGTGSDSIAFSRNGKWAVATDYQGGQIALAAVDAATGGLVFRGFQEAGTFPVSVALVAQ